MDRAEKLLEKMATPSLYVRTDFVSCGVRGCVLGTTDLSDQKQEEMIANYLIPTIENIKTYGKAQTKPLDGVLAHIAIKQLREQFPNKYISFRLNQDGERYIIINEFQH